MRKRNRKEVLANYNKTKIVERWNWRNRWEFKLMCHCACSSEIGTGIINDAGRQAAHKNLENTCFWLNYVKQRSMLMFWRYILTFKAIVLNHQNQRHYACTFKCLQIVPVWFQCIDYSTGDTCYGVLCNLTFCHLTFGVFCVLRVKMLFRFLSVTEYTCLICELSNTAMDYWPPLMVYWTPYI